MRVMIEPFATKRAVIGVVHLRALPGSPRSATDFDGVLDAAVEDARAYASAGFDAVMVENHGDAPFRKEACDPHVPAFLGLCARVLRDAVGLPVGVNCLRNDAHAALGAAAVAGAALIRVNVLVGAVATDQGIIEGCADSLLRYRRRLGATGVGILADVHVKFGTQLYDAPAPEQAVAALGRGGADGIIVTGSRTGSPPTPDDVMAVRDAVGERGPVVVGSGATEENARELLAPAHGVIVGSSCKRGSDADAPVDRDRAARFMTAVRSIGT